MSLEQQVEAAGQSEGDSTSPRDYETEARSHGWTPKEEFKGDPARWVDAEAFVKRADEVMPFLKKQNAALKRDLDDMKKVVQQFGDYHTKVEQRAYERAVKDLQSRHDDAVEAGDVKAARAVLDEMDELKKDIAAVPKVDAKSEPDPEQARRELAEWVDENDWYVTDDKKRQYADLQASLMGPAHEWDGGPKEYLAELAKRVDRKFAEKPPTQTSGAGNRTGGKSARSFADLPAEAKRQCERFVKTIPGFTRDQYVKDYAWE